MPKPAKRLDISSSIAHVAPELLQALTILQDKTIKRIGDKQENLKLSWKSVKRSF